MAISERWVHGDGGPLILVQAAAVPLWRGARGPVGEPPAGHRAETDYDVICRCPDGVTLIERHGREMLVLTDSEWAGCFVPSPRGEVVVVQPFGVDGPMAGLVERITATPASETLRMRILDSRLRLLPGADHGSDSIYGFDEVEVRPGEKACEVWYRPDAQVVVLRPA